MDQTPVSDDLDEITTLLGNTSLRAELPDPYTGELVDEFQTVVALESLACVALVCGKKDLASSIHITVRKFVHQLNNLYFAMHNERALRFTDEDVTLANAHAIGTIPVECGNDNLVVDGTVLKRFSRATSNICHETIQYLEFITGEFRAKHRTTAKEQCKRAAKRCLKLGRLLRAVTNALDKQLEFDHMVSDTSKLTNTDRTAHEVSLLTRKSRKR
jgi:hypothetical protein